MTKATDLKPGDRIDVSAYGEGTTVRVLACPIDSTETVGPLAGRPCIRYWCVREDTGTEGFMTFGPSGRVVKL